MKRILAPLVLLASLNMGMNVAMAADAAPAYTTEDSTIGDMLDDPKAKAVLERIIPDFVNSERIDEARGMTLRAVQPYAAEMLTDDVLAKIDAELAKLGTAK